MVFATEDGGLRDQISHLYKTMGRTIVSYIPMIKFLDILNQLLV
jgi:hypothetical protein